MLMMLMSMATMMREMVTRMMTMVTLLILLRYWDKWDLSSGAWWRNFSSRLKAHSSHNTAALRMRTRRIR